MHPNLFLYSNQGEGLTDRIDEWLVETLPRNAHIAYLPSAPDPDRYWHRRQASYYNRFGFLLESFGLDEEFYERKLNSILECDAVHLSGGNTFQFLYWLRRRGMYEQLIGYVEKGGIIVGVSAGAILMTPTIQTSYLCGDTDYPGLNDFRGLCLVDFEVFPHFDGSIAHQMALSKYSSTHPAVTFGVPDGSGIVVMKGIVNFMGPVTRAEGGTLKIIS